MADVAPFKGVRYDTQKINSLSDVVAPPFDVISKPEQLALYDRHPHNIIRLVLGKPTEADTITNNPHTRSAAYLRKWLAAGILKQDKLPHIYFSAVDFYLGSRSMTRYGLIARVVLEPFEKGIVLPHEKTFSKVKTERLGLMKACHANFSPIFSLYSDDNYILDTLKTAAAEAEKESAVEHLEYDGQRHRMWPITDPDVHRYVTDSLKGKTLLIADGHHRYETALRYREWISGNHSDFPGDHPANYVMMYLSSMQDPGLVILPAHRLLKDVPPDKAASFMNMAKTYFDITTFPIHETGAENARAAFLSTLQSNNSRNRIGVIIKSFPDYHVLTLKPNTMARIYGNELSNALIDLDVTVLTHLIFVNILGFDQARLDNEKLVGYTSCENEAIETVAAGKFDMAFILNPTQIGQVNRVAGAGLTMPRKSTYFYPKVITGQVLYRLIPQN